MNRNELILTGCNKTDPIVEIGPCHAPIAAKRDGWPTVVVDHASREDLRAKYGQFPGIDIDRIEEVDHIWQGGPLDTLFQPPVLGQVQRVISSHSIEHIPDPVGFLAAASRLTHPQTGTVCLAVPDKRYCFDVFRSLTSTGDWLDAWREKRGRHSGASVFDHLAYEAKVDDVPWWTEPMVSRARLQRPVSQAFEVYSRYEDTGRRDYVDVHGWVFTPASFQLLILELWLLGILDWEVESCQSATANEFIVLLRRATHQRPDADAQNERRHQLLQQLAEEVARTGGERSVAVGNAGAPGVHDAGQALMVDHLQQIGRELAVVRREVGEMRDTQRDLQRMVDLLRRVRARWPRWLGGTRSPQPVSARLGEGAPPTRVRADVLVASLGDPVVLNCCAHLSVQDGGLGLFRLIHLVDAVVKLPQAPKRIFSIGSGVGYHEAILARLFPSSQVVAIDIDERAPRYPQANLVSMRMDILSSTAPLPGTADFVYSIECLEHIADDRAAFAAMSRLLARSGHFYIEVPYANESERQDPQLREHEWKHFEHHTPGYDRAQLAALAQENGLGVVEQGNVFWSPLQSLVWAATEKFPEDAMRNWMAPLISLLHGDIRAEEAQGRHQALGVKMLCRKAA
ncbi:class I SAM-dependent methyltransferase [Pseudorhodoferax sp.]|uniref:class I SAM-dependent methyltransferase n=1 Tax=Pseudorhodoferax sp. TaxID=1993553 RepID=UPI002DD6547E|nr:class I SAM-dependent methyltransferase [Pseudorhodoferax sp.]